MKKPKLDVDALSVEPFETGAAPELAGGSVQGDEMETRRQDSRELSFCCRGPAAAVPATGLCADPAPRDRRAGDHALPPEDPWRS